MYTGGYCVKKEKKPAEKYDFCWHLTIYVRPRDTKGECIARTKYNYLFVRQYKKRYFASQSFANLNMPSMSNVRNSQLQPQVHRINDRALLRYPVLDTNTRIWM